MRGSEVCKTRNDVIEVVQKFCYLGDVVESSDVQSLVTARIRAGW